MRLIILFSFILLLGGCTHRPPKVDVEFWAGDSAHDGISRTQDDKMIQCRDTAFDDYGCLSYEDIREIFDAMLECQKYPGELASDPKKIGTVAHVKKVRR